MNSQANALKQLNKRVKINLIYDPEKKFMKEKENKKSVLFAS